MTGALVNPGTTSVCELQLLLFYCHGAPLVPDPPNVSEAYSDTAGLICSRFIAVHKSRIGVPRMYRTFSFEMVVVNREVQVSHGNGGTGAENGLENFDQRCASRWRLDQLR